MLHVGEMRFTPVWNFNPGWIFFRDTRTFHLGLETENFHPGVKWISWPFYMIFYLLSFYKNTDILITDNRSVISYRLGKKENSCALRFYISRFCKYCLLALYSCIEHWGEIGKLKEKLKYIHYLLFPGLTSNLFVQELGILNMNLRPALYGNILSYLI